ncbi:ParA family protein [Streptomyces sp. NBC_01264]|uniref:ParA family protein n=1 Tax=Streptomyces sp. NBC_01264 TaxID=2903804 RepID=UPI0022592933|nr:ParA family protein [Streptomyces sp. NBC_01264]MCX4784490.1 ParA family protein [Streptomyces sp. NBC_01264]
MVIQSPSGDREKVVSKLPAELRQDLKVRAAELGVDIQDAVTEGIDAWRSSSVVHEVIDTAGSVTFSTWLFPGQWEDLKETCGERGIPFVQGLAQSVALWLATHPSPKYRPVTGIPRRIVVCNQKGGVGKTAVSAGVGEALAEGETYVTVSKNTEALLEEFRGLGLRVLLVDYDPQGHLTKQLGLQSLPAKGPSLAKFMAGQIKDASIRDLVVVVEDERYGGRLHVLPSCPDAFLLDIMIAMDRNRQATLERALEPLEKDYDVIVVDSPPSLGVGMDAAIYYGRRREGEAKQQSGVMIIVQAEDSSADAYELLIEQIESGKADWRIDVEYLGLVVNMYDARDGYVVTSSLREWESLGDPRVLAKVARLKEQREAVRNKTPLLSYSPECEQAMTMRKIVREIT